MFKTSNEAISYGLMAGKKDRNRLARLRVEFSQQTSRALNREQFNLASMFATQAQFCREALEAETLNARAGEIFPGAL